MKRLSFHIAVFLFVGLVAITGLSDVIHNKFSEYRFQTAPQPATGRVVLVAIDHKSLSEINKWPWPRSIHAELINKLTQAGAGEIAFDVDFSAASTSKDDEAMTEALKSAGGSVILPTFRQVQRINAHAGSLVHNLPLPEFQEHSWLAGVNIYPERNGQINKMPYGHMINGKFVPSLAAMLSGVHKPQAESFYVDYSIQAATVPVVSYVDIIKNRINPNQLKDKKIVIGATATELGDRMFTPGQGIVSGPMLQILAAETLMQNRALFKTNALVTIFGLLLIAASILVLSRKIKLAERLYLFLVAPLVLEAAALLALVLAGLIVNTSLWHAAFAGYFGATLLNEVNFRKLITRLTRIQLAETQQMFEQAFNDSFTGTIIADDSGIVQASSKTTQAILKISDNEPLIGRHYNQILPPEIIAAADRMLARENDDQLSSHYSNHVSLPVSSGDTTVLEYIVTKSTLPDADREELRPRRILSFSFQDITARQRAVVAQQQATEAAIQANKAKTDFLTNMSHELRTPLNAILGFSELIEHQSLGPDKMAEYSEFARDIKCSGQQLLRVVNDIIQLTRVESGAINLSEEQCDIVDMIEYAIEDTSILFRGHNLNLVVEHSEDLPDLTADAGMLHQTLNAIISNAIKFSDDETEIIIKAEKARTGEVTIAIRDLGTGISQSEIENIFKPFYQIDSAKNRQFEGTGLGLTRANAYMKMHGGRIKVASKLGEGTTIYLTFPSDRAVAPKPARIMPTYRDDEYRISA